MIGKKDVRSSKEPVMRKIRAGFLLLSNYTSRLEGPRMLVDY